MKANKIEIPISFNNYKLLTNHEFTLSGSYIYFILGSNNKGKTSFKNAIASMLTAKNVTDEPVTRGERKGFVSGVFPAADGKMYSIDWNFTNEKSQFIVTRPDGTKIDKVNEIRELFKYNHFTASEFLNWSLTAEGIRKQVKVLLSLLPQEMQGKYDLFTAEEAEIFDLRKDKKKEVDNAEKKLVPVSPEVETLISNEDKAKARIKSLEDELQTLNEQNIKFVKTNTVLSYLKSAIEHSDILSVDAKTFINIEIEALELDLSKIDSGDFETKKADINSKLEVGREYLNKIILAKANKQNYNNQLAEVTKLKKELADLEERLEKKRAEKKQLLADGKLPFNLDITDDGVVVDGFAFKESQVCRSAAIKTVAAIMCKINPSPILLMDAASELDNASLIELNKLAGETNHIMIFDSVERMETELQVVGYDEV